MKSLYDKNFKYTYEASALADEAQNVLDDLFAKYVDLGYSPREISHILQAVIQDLECSEVLREK